MISSSQTSMFCEKEHNLVPSSLFIFELAHTAFLPWSLLSADSHFYVLLNQHVDSVAKNVGGTCVYEHSTQHGVPDIKLISFNIRVCVCLLQAWGCWPQQAETGWSMFLMLSTSMAWCRHLMNIHLPSLLCGLLVRTDTRLLFFHIGTHWFSYYLIKNNWTCVVWL